MFFGDYIDSPTTPLFAFGHGLSYTTFAYRNLAVQAKSTTEPIEVSIEVHNTGEQAGDEVVQLYYRDEVASVARPERMLLGFARLSLMPGQTRRVTFTVHPSRLAFYDPQMRFVTEPGAFTFSVGASSADIRAEQTVTLDGQVAEYQQREIVATKVAVV
jgi:beta-glucosidase